MIYEPTSNHILKAATLLRDGHLVGIPTETVYGLAADATSQEAVQKIYDLKGRPAHNPLIVHLAQWEDAEIYAFPSALFFKIISYLESGPLTLVLQKRPDALLAPNVTAGLSTVALRVPFHPVAHALLKEFGGPLAAPSANKSGKLSPVSALHVEKSFEKEAPFILDGGVSSIGIESTILDLSGPLPHLLRPGLITKEEIQNWIGVSVITSFHGDEGGIKVPGQLPHHYAPDVPLRLNATAPKGNEIFIGFGPHYPGDYTLSASGSLKEAAGALFGVLHTLNAVGRPLAIAPIPREGIGIAINDRLSRAALRG